MRLKLLPYRGYILHSLDCHLTVHSVGSHITVPSSLSVPVTSTHPSTHWAAVTTHSGLMIEPPHLWLPVYSNDTWNIINETFYWKIRLLGRWTLNSLRNLELKKFLLDVKSHSFTWCGKSSMFTGQPPTIRPSRRGRGRGVAAPEKKIVDLWPNVQRYLLLH
jgi:hypothetical protein